MSRTGREDENLDELLGGITDDVHGDDETLWALRQAFADDVTLPADGFVIGEPVSVTEIDYDGNECGAWSRTSGRGRHGKRTAIDGHTCEGSR